MRITRDVFCLDKIQFASFDFQYTPPTNYCRPSRNVLCHLFIALIMRKKLMGHGSSIRYEFEMQYKIYSSFSPPFISNFSNDVVDVFRIVVIRTLDGPDKIAQV